MSVAVQIKKAEPATTGTTNGKTSIGTSIQHYALVYPEKYKKKPTNHAGKIHNYFKANPYPAPYSLHQLLDAFCSGQTLVLANTELQLKRNVEKSQADAVKRNSREWIDLHITEFVSTQLIGIDIDDEFGETDISTVLKHFKGKVAAAYYSFSHERKNSKGGKENRYRLLFQLSELITDYEIGKQIAVILRDEFLVLYPNFSKNDIDTMTPKTLWYGSSRPPIIVEDTAFLDAATYSDIARKEIGEKRKKNKERLKQRSNGLKENLHNPRTFEELEAMARVIGHIGSGGGEEQFRLWTSLSLSIRSYVFSGHITEDEGFQLFDIISGGEDDETKYFGFESNGTMSIGTFISHAIEKGYKAKKSYAYALRETVEVIETEHIKVPVVKGKKTHIPMPVAKELIQRRQRLLVDSATGSGKTTAFIQAFKELANGDDNYYIFTAPTRAIAEQTATEHNLPCIVGGIQNLKTKIQKNAVNGQRVFVSVYDKTAELMSFLSEGTDPTPKFHLVIDEYHKFIEAHSYRGRVIDELDNVTSAAASLIGLSGTPNDINKSDFDKMIVIDTNNKKSPCLDLRVFTYDTRIGDETVPENADLMLMEVIQALLKQTRVLVFVNKKERIQSIARRLKKNGVKTSIITSDSKKSATYRGIVENSTLPDDVQVVLTTVVIADGISINNDKESMEKGLDWSCLVVADDSSPIFNPSTIKQISNRFRDQYRYFALYMRTPNPDYSESKRFNIEADYQHRLKTVTSHVDYLNKEFEGQHLTDFIPSNVERDHGVFYRSTDESAVIEFNPLNTRNQSMRTMERYYKTHRNAFIKETERLIGLKVSAIVNVNDEAARKDADLSGLLAEIQQEKEESKLEAHELRANFKDYFDEGTYLAIIHGDNPDSVAVFKKNVHPDQYAATLKNARIADYETCFTLGNKVKRRADINSYTNDIQALADIASFHFVKRVTVTKRIFNELLKMAGTSYLSADFKKIVDFKIPKKLKVKQNDVKEALKLFHKYSARTKKDRYTSIEPMSIEQTACLIGVGKEAIKKSLVKLIDGKKAHDKKILLPAVVKSYDISQEEYSRFLS